jgi:hypothetical protein
VIDKLPVVGGPQMAEYRAFILDEDGHIDRAVEFVCPDDGGRGKIHQAIRRFATFDAELE